MPDITTALQVIRPGSQWSLDGDDYSGITWMDDKTTQPTLDEVNAEIAIQEQQAPLDACKAQAKTLIAATDWAVLPDVGLANVSEYTAYRATLRQLILNPVASPVWPTEPTPVWS